MGLKIRCPKGRAGSTPALRATYHNPIAVYTDDTQFSVFQKSVVGAFTLLFWSSGAGDCTVNTWHLCPQIGDSALMDFAGAR